MNYFKNLKREINNEVIPSEMLGIAVDEKTLQGLKGLLGQFAKLTAEKLDQINKILGGQ